MRRLIYVLIAASSATSWGAEWLTDGGSQQRVGWQRDEHILTTDNVKGIDDPHRKIKLDSPPREMHALFPPLIAENIKTQDSVKQIAIEAGISDNLFAIDVETGKVLWQRHFSTHP